MQLQAVTNKFKSLNQFLERQTAERENERTDFDKKLEKLKEQSKDRERELYSKYEAEVKFFMKQFCLYILYFYYVIFFFLIVNKFPTTNKKTDDGSGIITTT